MKEFQIPDNLVPMVYLVLAGVLSLLTKVGVNAELVGMIVGAAITRVKVSPTTPTVK